MLSAVIPWKHSYPALPLTRQPAHQRFPQPGPLVLGSDSLKNPTLLLDRDRAVSRRSEPSSRTALTGEQTDPWDLLQPQDAVSRPCVSPITWGIDYTITPICIGGLACYPFHTLERILRGKLGESLRGPT